MLNDATIARLGWHAGFNEAAEKDALSISSCTYPLENPSPELNEAVTDCLQTLAVLNNELNGDTPSGSNGGTEKIPRKLAYAISEIVRMIRECHMYAQNAKQPDAGMLARFAWRVETAWSAVLAGDIDNIIEHVEGVEAARFS